MASNLDQDELTAQVPAGAARAYTVLYRIHTEATTDFHLSTIHSVMSERFDAYNVIIGQGCWKDQREVSATIEVYGIEQDIVWVRDAAYAIRNKNVQEAVLVSRQQVTAELI